MYKHIMVAIDDSQTSRKALEEAIAIARLHGAPLEIVHAVDEALVQAFKSHGAALADLGHLEQALEEGGSSLLEEAVDAAKSAGVEARKRLLTFPDTHAADQIATAAVESEVDLLVVGSHGRRGVRRLLLGSVAENLVRKVSTSILIVRGH
ncbi:MAG: universal stress protein [Rhodocyclaceae bacterium]|jgi:nucleotide-binding universal stress UspA family protein|nr:universal stress protein [Rhodocyclaceae bacterium]MCL4756767.1 universal stress protein [Rhodocyclaceae bacterium]